MNKRRMEFELFSDPGYYDMWALRRKGERSLNKTLHFAKKQEAEFAAYVIADWFDKTPVFYYD
jgi:hypothetical protein